MTKTIKAILGLNNTNTINTTKGLIWEDLNLETSSEEWAVQPTIVVRRKVSPATQELVEAGIVNRPMDRGLLGNRELQLDKALELIKNTGFNLYELEYRIVK